jgi:hypothetical protein
MAPSRRSGVTGDKELVAALRELAKGPTAAEVDSAAIEAMQPMLQKTRTRVKNNRNYVGKWLPKTFWTQPRVPRRGGHVDEGIVVRKIRVAGQKRAYRLGATRRSRYLLHLLEFGTAPHFQPNFHGGFMHPGARAFPALLPSFDEERRNVPPTFGRLIWSKMSAKMGRMKKAPRRRK